MTLDWARDGADWPNREASRFIDAAGLRWHVQIAGEGPVLLLLHGTGSATHSWRDLFPLLARHARVIAPDLPGHGFTGSGPLHRLSLPGMSQSLAGLLAALGERPDLAVGHSAGAAVAIRMTLDRAIAPDTIAALNPALLPFGGLAGQLFSPLAKLLVFNPLVPRLFAWRAADRAVVDRLIRETGSTIDERGVTLYQRVVRDPDHAAGALGMMANWDLQSLATRLPELATPLVLLVGERDRTIPPAQAREVKRKLPAARLITLPGLGHLAHEERPALVADLLLPLLPSRADRAA
jgi:magnesium chelatase accessory protein